MRIRFEGGGGSVQPRENGQAAVIEELVRLNFFKKREGELIWYKWRVICQVYGTILNELREAPFPYNLIAWRG